MIKTDFRRASVTVAALAAGTLVALAPVGATAQTATGPQTAKQAKAADVKEIKRLAIKPRHGPRGSAKRPPRGSRPKRRGSRATGRLRVAQYFTGECQINHIPSYPNGQYLPYTWVQFQANGVWFGYYIFNRYGLTWGLNGQIRECRLFLGNQYEYYHWSWNGRSWQWQWLRTTNCDPLSNCKIVAGR